MVEMPQPFPITDNIKQECGFAPNLVNILFNTILIIIFRMLTLKSS